MWCDSSSWFWIALVLFGVLIWAMRETRYWMRRALALNERVLEATVLLLDGAQLIQRAHLVHPLPDVSPRTLFLWRHN